MAQSFTSNSYARGPEVIDLSGMTQQVTDLSNLVGTVQTSANGKNSSFHLASVVNGQPNQPPNTTDNPRVVGDLWFQTDKQNAVYKWDAGGGGQWLPATLGDGAIGNLNVGHLTTGTLNATVTLSGTIATATGNVPRVQIDSNGITAFKDTTTVPYFSLDKNGVVINGGIIRTAPTGARWEISSTLGTVSQATNLINGWPGSTAGDSAPATIQVDYNPGKGIGNVSIDTVDTPFLTLTTPRLGTNGGYGSISMYGARRDGGKLAYFQYSAPAGHTFTGAITTDGGLTMELGSLVMGKVDSPTQRIIYLRKFSDDFQTYGYESRTYITQGQVDNAWTTVLYRDEGNNGSPVLTNRMNLYSDRFEVSKRVWIQENRDASTESGNLPTLMVGPNTGTHLRIDGNEVIAMTSDTAQGTLYLNTGAGVNNAGRLYGSNTGSSANFGVMVGTTTMTAPSGGGVVSKTISLLNADGSARFLSTPNIQVSVNTTGPGPASGAAVSYNSASSTSFDLYFYRSANIATTVSWSAIATN